MRDSNIDETEDLRRAMVREINTEAAAQTEESQRALLEAQYGKDQVWNTQELGRDFEVIGFLAPFTIVKRIKDGAKGTVMFSHSPRFYFGFQAD